MSLRRVGLPVVALVLASAALAGDEPFPGFCSGLLPPPPDAFEPDDSLPEARPINVADGATVSQIQLHSFHSDNDEDWLVFRGFGSLSESRIFSLDLSPTGFPILGVDIGTGIRPVNLTSMEGTGLCVELFRSSGDEIAAFEAPTAQCLFFPYSGEPDPDTVFSWQLDAQDNYFVRLFQLRNAGLDINGGDVPDNQEFCIPVDTEFNIQAFEPIGFQFGRLAGTVTDGNSGQAIAGAQITGTSDTFFSVSNPGSGSYELATTVATAATSQIMAPGYQSADIQFDIVESQTTTCDITLTPEVAGSPDLIVNQPAASSNTVILGDSLTLSANARNVGDGGAVESTLRYVFSPDAVIEPADFLVGSQTVPSLSAGAQFAGSLSVQVPDQPGTYFTGACVDAVAGESDGTNNCFGFAPVVVGGGADFIFSSGFEEPLIKAQAEKRLEKGKGGCLVL